MLQRFIRVTFAFVLANFYSLAVGEQPTAQPRQFILHARCLEGRPYRNDGSPEHAAKAIRDARAKHWLRVISEPNLAFVENHKASVVVGGELDAGVTTVAYGTVLDAMAQSNRNGTIHLDFVAEHSCPTSPRPSDLQGHATLIETEKVCGRIDMRPGVVYRIQARQAKGDETWWEFEIESAENVLPAAK